MVRGAVVTVTPVPGTYQCAETDRIALGFAIVSPLGFGVEVVRNSVQRIAMAEEDCGQYVGHQLVSLIAKLKGASVR